MTEFHVPQMSCGACASRIEKALAQAALPEHTQVEIDVARKTVRVPEGSAQVLQAVQAAIEAAGYAVQSRPAAAPERSGGCCCGARRAAARDLKALTAG